jgi:hypothetical protein
VAFPQTMRKRFDASDCQPAMDWDCAPIHKAADGDEGMSLSSTCALIVRLGPPLTNGHVARVMYSRMLT